MRKPEAITSFARRIDEHLVRPNESNRLRISVSFNAMLRTPAVRDASGAAAVRRFRD